MNSIVASYRADKVKFTDGWTGGWTDAGNDNTPARGGGGGGGGVGVKTDI